MNKEKELISIEIVDNVIFGEYHPDLKIDLEAAKRMVRQRLELQKGEDYPVLIKASLNSFTKEAREYMKNEGTIGIKAGAFIVDNILTKSILNFFIAVTSPKIPSKIFTSEKDALEWLEQYK